MRNTKRTLVFSLFILVSSLSFSETQTGLKSPFSSISVGAYGIAQIARGSYADYASIISGGGIVGEYMVAIIPGLGLSARVQAAFVVPKEGSINSYQVLGAFGGAFWRFPLRHNFSFQPEFAAGMWINSIDASGKDESGLPAGTYVDPAIQVSLALRWKTGRINMELAPVYTILPEKSAALNLLGLRLGAVYTIK